MIIFFTNIKTLWHNKLIFFLFLAIIFLLIVGFFGVISSFGNNSIINIAVVDLDKSFETELIVTNITQSSEYENLINFHILNIDEANTKLQNSEITSIVVFPYGFGNSIATGENIPFNVYYNANTPFVSALVNVISNSFSYMLGLGQIGVYTALNYIFLHHPEEYNNFFWSINFSFLNIVLNRSNIFTQTEITTNDIPIIFSYIFSGYVTLLFCVIFIFSEFVSKNFNSFVIQSFISRNNSNKIKKMMSIILGCSFYYFFIFLCINILIFFTNIFIGFDINFSTMLAILFLNFITSFLLTFFTFIFKNTVNRYIFMTFFIIYSLFFSGGIIPLQFLRSVNPALYYTNFSYLAVKLLSGSINNENIFVYVFSLILFCILSIFITFRKILRGAN
ncbi:MAG: ABC transporter permease [Defluviitaleaceae bacterium]|nr:ABC transporter permease [Defluviitaleaceae bacterium]